ncbi:MAG TPA: sigma-70 family RNA polymerase sigma factor [Kofleriaceae bacterium]|nr:sigma-70 family RNA polymerase sigma factor [Kofleriaceae bacterium]
MTNAQIEDEVLRLLRGGDIDAATTVALRGYGPEVLGFLAAVSKNEADARDAFSEFSEDLWNGLPKFQASSSLRTWAYTIARRALWRVMNDPRRRAERNVPLSQAGVLEKIAAEVRESTTPHLRTEVKDGFAALRAQLPADEQTLLVLRVDRDLAWRDIASVMHEGEGELTGAALEREAAALRKRFERVKQRLRELGEKAGLAKR